MWAANLNGFVDEDACEAGTRYTLQHITTSLFVGAGIESGCRQHSAGTGTNRGFVFRRLGGLTVLIGTVSTTGSLITTGVAITGDWSITTRDCCVLPIGVRNSVS